VLSLLCIKLGNLVTANYLKVKKVYYVQVSITKSNNKLESLVVECPLLNKKVGDSKRSGFDPLSLNETP